MIPDSGRMSQADIDELAARFSGEIRFGQHDRMLYATDASMYQVEPLGVVLPRNIDDITTIVHWCSERGLPVLPRGGGTSLAGQTVNTAMVVDCSAHLRKIGEVNVAARRVYVEPGVVLDDLQCAAAAYGLRFGPEVSTSTHATLGGMISNRSAGLHSLKWGMTDAHVAGVDVVLADGRCVRLERGAAERDPIVADLTAKVADVVLPLADQIDARYPKLRRNVGGYALDRILDDLRRCEAGRFDQVDLSGLIAGSEGTLGFLVGAELKLVPNPAHIGLSILAFEDVSSALWALSDILKSNPSAVELLDGTVLSAARSHETYRHLADLLPSQNGVPADVVLYVDWFADDEATLEQMMSGLEASLPEIAIRRCMDAGEQADLWRLRKVGLGLILTGDACGQAVGGLEDCAVPPEHLAEFQHDFESMLAAHGLHATWYAHASVGLLHVRPRIDLRQAAGRDLLKRLATEATPLVQRYGGTVSGEHGDGRIRAAMMHEFYGPQLVKAFRDIKQIFDPNGRFNPGIITTDPGMMEHLRIAEEVSTEVPAWFHWEPSLDSAASACNGNALCRRTSGGAMCPSYRATLDERHATRGRGNALRLAITGQFGPERWTDPDTHATLDLCLGCKACRYECPASVDVAKLKAEYLAQSMKAGRGPTLRTRLKGNVRRMNRIGSALHPVSTWLMQRGPTAWMIKRMMGIADSRTLPGFSRSLIGWHARREVSSEQPVVLLYPDCFTTWSESSVGHDAIFLLEAFGYRVVIPDVGCCGRTQISAGLLDDAARIIGQSATSLAAAIEQYDAVAVVAVEPSCATAMQQEWMELRTEVPPARMEGISTMIDTVEGFIASQWESHPKRPDFEVRSDHLPIHQHCHQKHRGELTESFLRRCGWPGAALLDTGCCGMAGAFGYERRHEALSRDIAEQSLAPLRGHSGPVAAGGTSCRHQAADTLQLKPVHPVSLAASALAGYPAS